MRKVQANQFEKVSATDFNNAQLAVHKSLFDDTLYTLFGSHDGSVNGGFAPAYVSALAATLAIGTAFMYDSTSPGYNPKFRMLRASALVPVTFAAADPTQDRIDLICVAPNFAVQAQSNRWVKTGGTGPVVQTLVDKDIADTYTLQVVTGTPSGSPTAPATPSGFLAVATARIHAATGLLSGADLTNLLTPLSMPVINSAFQRYVSPSGFGTDTTLAAAMAALPSGGIIFVMESIALGASTFSLNVANIEIRAFPNAVISGTGIGFTVSASGVRIKGPKMSGFATAVALNAGSDECFVTECRFVGCTNDVVDSSTNKNNVVTMNTSS